MMLYLPRCTVQLAFISVCKTHKSLERKLPWKSFYNSKVINSKDRVGSLDGTASGPPPFVLLCSQREEVEPRKMKVLDTNAWQDKSGNFQNNAN